MQHRTWVKSIDINVWSNSLEARQKLPKLLRRLTHATLEFINLIEFPSEEEIQRPGWDGIIDTPSGNEFVPKGLSVWELGTDKTPAVKAEEDFQKRTNDPLGVDTKNTSFVFVTPRRWTGKTKWCDKKLSLGIWQDVRVYDASNLEEWLECAPAVDGWFARIIGKRPLGVTDLSEHWENLTAISAPPLQSAVFLASRDKEMENLSKWLDGPPSVLAFEAHAPIEVVDFLAAYLASIEESRKDVYESRIVVVDQKDSWHSLSSSRNRLTLVSHPELRLDPELLVEAVRGGHHVLVSSSRFAIHQSQIQKLPSPFTHDLAKALEASGLNHEQAHRISRESGGSLLVLKRLVSRYPHTSKPSWSRPGEVPSVIPFLLAGGWDDGVKADQIIMEKLAGRPYKDVLDAASHYLAVEDPPITRIHSRWSLVSRLDSWMLIAPHLNRNHLEAFEEVAMEVLSENNPKFELPPKDQWAASIHNKVPKYSPELSRGLLETVTLLGSRPELISQSLYPASRAERLTRKLLEKNATWKRWATLSEFLPLLAEASPEAFLDAVEQDLNQTDPVVMKLFIDEGDVLFSYSSHTGLLWALETLAWAQPYLTRVCLIFAKLSKRDPGGRLANRPDRSLREIFLPWMPQTEALADQRLKVLHILNESEPTISQRLLFSLLPQEHDISSPTNKPLWRDWAILKPETNAHNEYWKQIDGIAGLILNEIKKSPDKWPLLIEEFTRFPVGIRGQILKQLDEADLTKIPPETVSRIWQKVREKVQEHRYFSDAAWALTKKEIDDLETVGVKYEPSDPIVRYTWLFGPHARATNICHGDPWDLHDKALYEERHQALQDILDSVESSGITKFTLLVELPFEVGFVLGKSEMLKEDSELFPGLLTSQNNKLVLLMKGYGKGRFASQNWVWVDKLDVSTWSSDQIGILSEVLPFERRSWLFFNDLGSDAHELYWKNVPVWAFRLSQDEVVDAIKTLLQFNRPAAALEVIAAAIHNKISIACELLAETLEGGLAVNSKEPSTMRQFTSKGYEIQQVFKYLQSDLTMENQRLAKLEWGYLPLLDGHGGSPKALHGWLAQNPSFFSEVISFVYKPRNQSDEVDESISKENQVRAQLGWDLLRSWQTLPGTLDNGSVDRSILLDWVIRAREECRLTDRLEACDSKIGELLAHSPFESDGSWPCIATRKVIDQTGSQEIIGGFTAGIFNKRGTVRKSLIEGGQQEHHLAETYLKYAKDSEIEWPKTAKALREVAERYKADAHREDEGAGTF